MPLDYVAKRFGMFLLIVWLAATVNFFLPRLGGRDPVRAAAGPAGGARRQRPDRPGGDDRRSTTRNSASTQPLWKQYLTYLGDMRRFDFNYSITNYPQTVIDIIGDALPWTLGLLTTTIIISWIIGRLLGAFMGWPRSPKFLQFLMPPLLSLNAIPFFLLGLVLIYVFAFRLRLVPAAPAATRPAPSRQWSFGVRPRRALPLGPARALDHPGLDRRLGARHARDDGHHPRRGLRHLRRRQGPQGPDDLRPLRRSATRSCRRRRRWRWRSAS